MTNSIKYFLYFFFTNIFLMIMISFININEIKKLTGNHCQYYVQIKIKTGTEFIYLKYNQNNFHNKIRSIFYDNMKKKHNILNSDNGFIIEKNGTECDAIVADIKEQIKNKNLSLLVKKNIDYNKKVFADKNFDPFRKSFNFEENQWNLVLAILNTYEDFIAIEVGEVKKFTNFGRFNFKIAPSILIIFFGNIFLLIFLIYKKKTNL